MKTPGANDARGQSFLHQPHDAPIRRVEVFGADMLIILLPGKPGFIGAALIESRHVGEQPCDDLDNGESLVFAVGEERVELIGER
jgi:hypothetical protein